MSFPYRNTSLFQSLSFTGAAICGSIARFLLSAALILKLLGSGIVLRVMLRGDKPAFLAREHEIFVLGMSIHFEVYMKRGFVIMIVLCNFLSSQASVSCL